MIETIEEAVAAVKFTTNLRQIVRQNRKTRRVLVIIWKEVLIK